MILNSNQIETSIKDGSIVIDPFNKNQLNPNSYDLRLAETVISYRKGMVFDCAKDDYSNPDNFTKQIIGPDGFQLYPGHLYLMATKEHTESISYVPMIEGRSSLARLGINVHNTAGFGDVGFVGTWTLEVSVINPVIIYANMRVCQLYFLTIDNPSHFYHGKYNTQKEPKTSQLFVEKSEWKIR